jgi:flavin reductase (DIM6/NTAB) family NADH-FMN oxidoreductase RutF
MLRERFLEGMSRAACTVSLVTTDGPAGRAGVTVSAMSSLSADPPAPTLLVCVHHAARAAEAIRANAVFCVNLLREDQSILSDVFAGRVPTESGDKFEAGEWMPLVSGAPILKGSIAAFDCRLVDAHRYASHWIFVGELLDLALTCEGRPLVYTNRTYGRPVPLEA